MATVANLKLLFGADTSGLEKGAKTAKESVRDFDKTAQDATDSIAGMFGVDTAAIDKMTSSLRGLGENLKTSANTGVASFGKMLASINGAAAGIAGLGIAAAVASFKLLNDEAQAFKNTVAGANIEMATATYVSTYRQALHDMNTTTGQTVAELEDKFKRGFARITSNFKQAIVNGLAGSSLGFGGNMALAGVQGIVAGQKAETAAEAQKEILNYTLQISEKEIEWMRTEARISELKLKVRDTSLSITERQRIQAELVSQINERYGEEYALRQKIAEAQATISAQASDDLDANEKKNQLAAQAERVQLTMNNALREASESGRTIAAEAAKEAEARKKSLEAISGQADKMADMIIGKSILGGTDLSISGANGLAAAAQEAFDKALGANPIDIPVRPEVDEEATKMAVIDLSREIAPAIEMISSSVGGLVGDLVTGGDAMANFQDSMLSGFADMAIAVGKIAVAAGVACLGIEEALKLHPAIAIAAGAALVALGSAVKAGLSNVASGNYSAGSTALSTAGASVGASGYSQSTLKVEVTGRLRASGSDLISVIEHENYRRDATT